ncbi:MAG: hypothetical protein SFT92_04905 [Rickettsiales bacterium]|nr:hypothetical protein [Rickettsiales bacterium]
MKKLMFAVVTAVLLSSCSNPMPDLKSPCVGAEGSPCDRRPVNQG